MEHLNYGAVGNCRTAALISDKGSIDWFCFPDFDSPSVFGKLLDEKKGGNMSFIVGNDYRISQRYLEHTNILSTLFEATEGAFEVIDFMPRYKLLDYDYYLPPELYRLIRLKRGTPRFRVNYNPALNYARGEVGHKTGPEYVKTYAKANERDTIYLYSGIPYDVIFNQQEVLLQRDEFLLVSYNQKLIPIDMNRVNLEFQRTRLYWMNWTNRSKKYTAFNEQIERSMLVLKLMSYQRSGAVLAAKIGRAHV